MPSLNDRSVQHRPDPSNLLEEFHLAPANLVVVDVAELIDHPRPSGDVTTAPGVAPGECIIVAGLRNFLSGEGPKRPFGSPWHSKTPDDGKVRGPGKPIGTAAQ